VGVLVWVGRGLERSSTLGEAQGMGPEPQMCIADFTKFYLISCGFHTKNVGKLDVKFETHATSDFRESQNLHLFFRVFLWSKRVCFGRRSCFGQKKKEMGARSWWAWELVWA